MARISTANSYEAGLEALQSRQRELFEAQTRLTSGKRVSRPSDDPIAAARAERALATAARADAHQRAIDASRQVMTMAESALGDANELLQQAREQLMAAGNGTWTAAERGYAADNLRVLRDQLFAVANRADGAGGYLFAGQGAMQAPFVDGAGGVTALATPGQQQGAGEEPLPLSVDGLNAWLGARSGNGVFVTSAVTSTAGAWIDGGSVTNPAELTGDDYEVSFAVAAGVTTFSVTRNGAATALTNAPYQPGQAIELDGMQFTVSGEAANGDRFAIEASQPELSAFKALDAAIAVLDDPLAASAQVTQAVKHGLRDVDAVSQHLGAKRSDTGAWLQRIDAAERRNADRKLLAQTERSLAEDLDMVAAISDFQSRQTGYDAALRAYSTVQRMSLFQYLG